MKHNVIRTMLMLSSFAVLLASSVPAAQASTCTMASATGNWGLSLTGTLLLPSGPVPAAAVIRVTLNMNGTLTGTEARSVGGGYADETAGGTWSVNADCTGTATVNFYEAGQLVRTSAVSFVIDDNSKEIRMVQKSLTLPDGTQVPVVVTVEGHKL
jgi:hypothetical protein